MRSPLVSFAGLLDRSVEQIAASSEDARAFDVVRIRCLADIWDNNTGPLVAAACAARPVRARRARSGLRWMAGRGAARRALMLDLSPALEGELTAAVPDSPVYRDSQGRVCPGVFPVTAQITADLAADYDLTAATVRSIGVQPAGPGRHVRLTLAAPRRFVPGADRVARALLRFTFTGVTDLHFDAADQRGVTITVHHRGLTVTLGPTGALQATAATVWPDDPRWFESAAGRAADAITPHTTPDRPRPVPTSSLAPPQRAAAEALTGLMQQVRLAGYYPGTAAKIPVREICHVAAGAGTAILAAGAKRGPAREDAFAELTQRWRPRPSLPPTPIPAGPAVLRYLGYTAAHADDDVCRGGAAVLVAAVPDLDPRTPWRLASEKVTQPTSLRLTAAAFDGTAEIDRAAGAITLTDALAIR